MSDSASDDFETLRKIIGFQPRVAPGGALPSPFGPADFREELNSQIASLPKHGDALEGARHAKKNIDAVIGYVQSISQILDNLSLCSDTLCKSSDEYVAQEAASVWGLPVLNMAYSSNIELALPSNFADVVLETLRPASGLWQSGETSRLIVTPIKLQTARGQLKPGMFGDDKYDNFSYHDCPPIGGVGFLGRRDVQGDNALGSLHCFNRMLRPSIYFTDDTVQHVGVDVQICNRVRYVMANVNSNLRAIHSISLSHGQTKPHQKVEDR